MQETLETRVRSLSREDPLEEGTATTSVFLPGKPQTEEPGGLQSMGVAELDMTEHTHT